MILFQECWAQLLYFPDKIFLRSYFCLGIIDFANKNGYTIHYGNEARHSGREWQNVIGCLSVWRESWNSFT